MATYRQPGHIKKPTFDGDGDIRGGVKLEWDREEGKEPNLDFSNTKSTPRLQIK